MKFDTFFILDDNSIIESEYVKAFRLYSTLFRFVIAQIEKSLTVTSTTYKIMKRGQLIGCYIQ